jgi:hypothetical protein
MNEVKNTIVFITVFFGFLANIIGHAILKLLIELLQKINKLIGHIDHSLIEPQISFKTQASREKN